MQIMSNPRILAAANMQFGQEMALVMQTTHAQRWQYPDRVDKRLFSSIENVHGYTKILEFEYKTYMFKKIPSWFIETFGCIFKIWVVYVIPSKN